MEVSRRKFLVLAAGVGATPLLPRSSGALLAESPAGEAVVPVMQRLTAMLTLESTYLALHQDFYKFSRYLSDNGKVLDERVEKISPERAEREWSTLGLFDRTQKGHHAHRS